MNAVPKRWFRRSLGDILNGTPDDLWQQTGDLMEPVYGDTDGLVLKCELADPPSMRGRSVNVWIRGEEVEWLLKLLRDLAIQRRSKGLNDVYTSPDNGPPTETERG